MVLLHKDVVRIKYASTRDSSKEEPDTVDAEEMLALVNVIIK